MAAKNADYTKMMQDMMGAFPVDMTAMQDAFKTQATLSDKLSKVALEAADKSTEISTKWTKDTLSKISSMTTVKDEINISTHGIEALLLLRSSCIRSPF